jgi:hypothetical protein
MCETPPWLDSVQPPIELVGVDSESENIHGVADALKVLRLRSSPGKAGPGSIAPTDRWAWLPPKLQEVWRSIGSEERNLVVIDSWDAFVGAYLGALAAPEERIPDQLEIERILLRAMTLVNAHLILIAERDRDAPLDYLVDGIVMLSMVTAGGRAERWLHVQKLRGVNVRETEYPFSLNAAKFNSLDTPPAGPSNPVVHYDHDPAPDKLSLWPGSRAFAEAFGRLQLGQLSLIEIDPGVPTTALRFVLIPIVESALQHGGRVFMAVPPAVSVEEIWEAMRNHMPLTRFLENVRIYPIGRTVVTHSELQRTLIELPRPRPGGGGSELESSFKFLTEPGAKGGLNAALAWHAGLRLLAASAGFEYTPDTAP